MICKEEEATIVGTNFTFVKDKGYPKEENNDKEKSTENFAESVKKICSWYKEHYPQLASPRTLDYQIHGAMLQSFILLKLDLDYLLKKIFNRVPLQTEQNKKTWETINQNLQEFFPTYSNFMIRYFEWHYQETKKTSYDLKSIPPIGRFIGILKRHFGYQAFYDREKDQYNKTPRSTSGRPYRSRSNHNTPYRKKESYSRRDEDYAKRDEEKKALQEVQEALKKFEKNPSLKVITLPPQNSYIRRVQHKKIDDSGFVSNSVGEDSSRSIQIKRL